MKRRVNVEAEKAKGEGEHLKCTHNAQRIVQFYRKSF